MVLEYRGGGGLMGGFLFACFFFGDIKVSLTMIYRLITCYFLIIHGLKIYPFLGGKCQVFSAVL